MKPIDLFRDALDAMLVAHGLNAYSTFAIWDIGSGTDEKTGYGVIARRPFTLRQARDVAIALSLVPGSAFSTVEQANRIRLDGRWGNQFLFHYHTGPAHAKMAAIAAMQAEVPQPLPKQEWVPA